MKLKDIQNKFHQILDQLYGKEEVDSFFFILVNHYYKISRIELAIKPDFKIKNQEVMLQALKALKNDCPIQYILGETEFYGLPFKVREGVLIPRIETEELVEWVILKCKGVTSEIKILDIGTGSGCIAISLAKALPQAKVYALDISEKALEIAKENAKLNHVDVTFIQADILKSVTSKLVFKKFDVIVSNPPYVRGQEKEYMKNNVLNYEPHLALFVENKNPLKFYKVISDFAYLNLKEGGKLFFEINEYLGNDMIQLLNNKQFKNIELKQDIFKKDRMIKGENINE